jgi:hypothetical protein
MKTGFFQIKPINQNYLTGLHSRPSLKQERLELNNVNYETIPALAYRAQYLPIVSFTSSTLQNPNMQLAKEAFDHVKKLNLVSSTRMEMDGNTRGEDAELYQDTYSAINSLNDTRLRFPIDKYVEFTNKMCPMLEVGNCSDQAVLTARFLKEEKNFNNFAMIAAIGVADEKAFNENPVKYACNVRQNHVFLVIGLDPEAKLNDPTTWGTEAVIVDPWSGICKEVSKGGIDEIKNLNLFNHNDKAEFMNYANFINPTKDENSPYDWENIKNKLV